LWLVRCGVSVRRRLRPRGIDLIRISFLAALNLSVRTMANGQSGTAEVSEWG